jgi:hypothetical protein
MAMKQPRLTWRQLKGAGVAGTGSTKTRTKLQKRADKRARRAAGRLERLATLDQRLSDAGDDGLDWADLSPEERQVLIERDNAAVSEIESQAASEFGFSGEDVPSLRRWTGRVISELYEMGDPIADDWFHDRESEAKDRRAARLQKTL